MDHEVEFSKIKSLLDRHPKVLREDPIIGMDYLRMINLIRKKRLLEQTLDPNDPQNIHESHYYDIDGEALKKALREERRLKEKLKQSEFDMGD